MSDERQDERRALDRAIDELIAGAARGPRGTVVAPHPDGLDELVALAARVQELPADSWPDPAYPRRLAAGLWQQRFAGHRFARRGAITRTRRTLRWGVTVAAAAACAIVLATALVLERSQPVSAATIARRSLAVSTGRRLPPVAFTQVITNDVVAGLFEPVPPPPRIVERVSFAADDRWRIDATVTQRYGAGTASTVTVRNGATAVAQTTSAQLGTTQTRARAVATLPTAAAYGAVDPLGALRLGSGRCRRTAAVQGGPLVDGRRTLQLQLGPDPCPSADLASIDGPATFLVDARTDLVLDASVHSSRGQLTERVRTTAVTFGATFAPGTFRLPRPLAVPIPPPPISPPPRPQPPTTRPNLQARAAFTVLLPRRLPPGAHTGAVAPVSTDVRGKLLGLTITYVGSGGTALVQLYEAPAAGPSVRFPGRRVRIAPGLTGTYSDNPPLRTLWWIRDGTYCALQEGGQSAGTPLRGTFSLAQLRAIAASTVR